MRSFNQLIGRQNRRKQSKVGRFDTDKYANDTAADEKTEYNLPNLRESEIERKKDEIRTELKRKKIKTWIYLAISIIAVICIYFYFLY